MIKRVWIFLLTISLAASGYVNASAKKEERIMKRVDELLAAMTLEEKVSLTSGRDPWATQDIERLGLPFIWLADGPHGLRRAPTTKLWGYGDQAPATCFPTASALAATWDADLIGRVGEALGQEARALGVNVLLGPGVNIKRSPLGGRNFEYFSEDPILSGKLGVAYVDGVQSQGVGTSLKHYVANNVETKRMWVNSHVDDRTLNEIYMTPFEMTIKEAQPWTVMACYNRVQGEYCTQSKDLLHDTLKEKWGFKGLVVSDWDAVIDRVEGIRAGMHLEMPGKPGHLTDKLVLEAVKSGELEEAAVDTLVRDILRVVLLAHDDSTEYTVNDNLFEENHQLARRVASEAVALLKNDGDVLPVAKGKYKKVAVIGEFAVNPRYQGNGSSEVKPTQLDKFLDIVRAEYGDEFEITYAQGYTLKDDKDVSFVEEAAKVAVDADIALVLAGLPQEYESEGIDRKHIDIPPAHNALISAVAKVQPNTALLMTNGSAIAMPWINEVPTIAATWLAGQAGAGGIADVVFGKVNPSGKLTETFAKRIEDTPTYLNWPGESGEIIYNERIFVGYRYYDARNIEPLFPFGHGLSYTDFEYTKIKVSDTNITDKDKLKVTVWVKNTGDITGKESVQLYVVDKESKVDRPAKELKDFGKVEIPPGKTKKLSFTLDVRDFSYYDVNYERWIAESGDFDILIGASSSDIRLTETITFKNTEKLNYKFDKFSYFYDFWHNPELQPLLIDLMPEWFESLRQGDQPTENIAVHDYLEQQPIMKYQYFTLGEIDQEDIQNFLDKVNSMTYTP